MPMRPGKPADFDASREKVVGVKYECGCYQGTDRPAPLWAFKPTCITHLGKPIKDIFVSTPQGVGKLAP